MKPKLPVFLCLAVACLAPSCGAQAAGPLRIISAAPGVTEILFELGLGPCVVGVTTACDYPESARRIERIGPFGRPNTEKVLALSPTLLIAADAAPGPAEKVLGQAGIRIIHIRSRSFEELFAGILKIGQATGAGLRARALVARLQDDLAGAATIYAGVPEERRPRVFVELWQNPMTTAGGNSLLDDVIVRAGGVNAARSIRQDFPQITPEAVIAWNPDTIVIARMLPPTPRALAEIRQRIGWKSIRAVREGKIITGISPDHLLRPGPRLALGVRELAEALYGQDGKHAR